MPSKEPGREEALSRLSERADALQRNTAPKPPLTGGQAAGTAYGLLGVLMGGPLVGVVLGLAIDGWLHVAPWGIISGVLIGFGVSIYLAMGSARRQARSAARTGVPVQDLDPSDDDGD
jgi:ATP synthase protein I